MSATKITELHPHRQFSSQHFHAILLSLSVLGYFCLDQIVKQMADESVPDPAAHIGETLVPAVSWGDGSAPSVPSVDNEDHSVRQHQCDISI